MKIDKHIYPIVGLLALGFSVANPVAADTGACLITKTDTNPFFVKMKEGATAKAEEMGVSLKSYAGKIDGDHESQVAAIETCIADGAKGILLAASDTKGIVPAVQQARDAGILVIALDTPLEPIDSADATFATDNFKAGELIGSWAKAALGNAAAEAKIARQLAFYETKAFFKASVSISVTLTNGATNPILELLAMK